MRSIITCILLLALLPGLSFATDDAATIDKLYHDYRAAVEAGSLDGYVAVLDPQVRLLPPGAPPIDGADKYASFLEPVLSTADYRIDVVSHPEITVMGDVATAEYEYVVHLSLRDPKVGISEPGALTSQRTYSRYLDVLRRQPDGGWAIWRHTWTVLEE